MTTYRPEPFFNRNTALIILAVFAGIGLFLGYTESVFTFPMFLGLAVVVIGLRQGAKKLFYNGQFGKTLTTEADTFRIDDNGELKTFKYKDVSEFGRYYVSKYGYKFHIKINDEEIKFFTPDAVKIEKEFVQLMASHSIELDKKGSFFPTGTTYIVAGEAPEGKVKKAFCAKCGTEVFDDDIKCPECKKLLALDGAVVERYGDEE